MVVSPCLLRVFLGGSGVQGLGAKGAATTSIMAKSKAISRPCLPFEGECTMQYKTLLQIAIAVIIAMLLLGGLFVFQEREMATVVGAEKFQALLGKSEAEVLQALGKPSKSVNAQKFFDDKSYGILRDQAGSALRVQSDAVLLYYSQNGAYCLCIFEGEVMAVFHTRTS